SNQSSLLVTGDTADRHGLAEDVPVRDTEVAGAVTDLRQALHRHTEELAQGFVPVALPDVEQGGATCIADVSHMHPPAGEPPDQEAALGAERKLPRLGSLARARHVLEDPGELGGREIRIEA